MTYVGNENGVNFWVIKYFYTYKLGKKQETKININTDLLYGRYIFPVFPQSM